MTPPDPTSGRRLEIRRVLPAPRERVFEAWTDAEQIKQWWARPAGVEVPHVEIDLRVGGSYRIVMQVGSEGELFPLSGRFTEVVPPLRLVYTFKWERDLPFPGGDYTGETYVTVEFHDRGATTELVLTHEGFSNEEISLFHDTGWASSLDRLEGLAWD